MSITTADGTPLRGVTTFAAGSMLNPIPNERQTGSVTWCKVGMLLGATDRNTSCDNLDSSSQQLLAGSEWTLTYIPYGKTESDKATCAITDTSSNCTLGDESNEIVWATKTATKTGNFTLTGLPWGTYTLVESKAPDGYTMSTKTHTFQIGPITDKDGTISYTFTKNFDPIINTTTVQLPETGGSGSNTLSVLVGFAITTFAMLALAVLMHRERRTYPKM